MIISYLCNTFFYTVTRYETVNHDLVGLTDTMGSREGLDIIVRIPIRIEDDDGIGGREVNTQTTSPKNTLR